MSFVKSQPVASLGLLIFLACISVLIRWPHLFERPLGNSHNEDALAHVLVTIKAYDETPWSTHLFRPIFTFGADHNKFIENLPTATLMDEKGNSYYISFPPMMFILPYLTLKGVGAGNSVISLRLFNVAIGLAVTLGIYFLQRQLLPNLVPRISNRAREGGALASAILYLFAASSLWAHGNSYWAHQLNQLWWVSALTVFVRDHAKGGPCARRRVTLIILVFLMCWTEWTGFIFAGALYCGYRVLYYWTGQRSFCLTSMSIGVMAVFSGTTIIAFYSYEFGLTEFFDALAMRASNAGTGPFRLIVEKLFTTYLWCVLPVFAVFLLLLLSTRRVWRSGFSSSCGSFEKRQLILWIAILLIPLLENVLVMKHSAVYDYATLKAVLAFSVFAGALATLYPSMRGLTMLLITYVCVNIAVFYYLNPVAFGHPDYNGEAEVARVIKETASPDNLAFSEIAVTPAVIALAERNIYPQSTLNRAQVVLKERGYKEGVFYWSSIIVLEDVTRPKRYIPRQLWRKVTAAAWIYPGESTPRKLRVYPDELSMMRGGSDSRLTAFRFKISHPVPIRFLREGQQLHDKEQNKFQVTQIRDNWVKIEAFGAKPPPLDTYLDLAVENAGSNLRQGEKGM